MPKPLGNPCNLAILGWLVKFRVGTWGSQLYGSRRCIHFYTGARSTTSQKDKQYRNRNQQFIHLCLLGCLTTIGRSSLRERRAKFITRSPKSPDFGARLRQSGDFALLHNKLYPLNRAPSAARSVRRWGFLLIAAEDGGLSKASGYR